MLNLTCWGALLDWYIMYLDCIRESVWFLINTDIIACFSLIFSPVQALLVSCCLLVGAGISCCTLPNTRPPQFHLPMLLLPLFTLKSYMDMYVNTCKSRCQLSSWWSGAFLHITFNHFWKRWCRNCCRLRSLSNVRKSIRVMYSFSHCHCLWKV